MRREVRDEVYRGTLACRSLGIGLLALVWHVVPGHLLAQQYSDFERAIARFDANIAADVLDDGIGSISAGVVIKDRLVWKKAWGWSDVALQVQADPEQVYRLGSVTKIFTVVLMMRLVEDGVIDLDESVEAYVPELYELPDRPAGAGPITFRHLASHTSGLASMPDVPEPYLIAADWEARLLEILPKTPIVGAPGAKPEYSSVGYTILGLALQRAAGRDFMELMSEIVVRPLGMTHTAYHLNDAMRQSLATAYQNYPDGRLDPDAIRRHQERNWFGVPASMLYSTVEDLARLIAVLMDTDGEPQIGLSPESVREIQKLQSVRETPRSIGIGRGYGLGLNIFEHRSGVILLAKDGYDAGYLAQIAFDPKRRIGIVLLRNYNEGATLLPAVAIELVVELGRTLDRAEEQEYNELPHDP